MAEAQCRYCGKSDWPWCMNSRDMEDMAIVGNDRCFQALERNGWGEKGEQYVRLNRRHSERQMTQYRAGRQRGETVLRQMPEGFSLTAWMRDPQNAPEPRDHDDFKAGYWSVSSG